MEDTLSYVIITVILLLIIVSITIYAVKEHKRAKDTSKQLLETKNSNVELQTTVDKLSKDNKDLTETKQSIEADKNKLQEYNSDLEKNVATKNYENRFLRRANNNLALNLREQSREIQQIQSGEQAVGISYKANNPTVYQMMKNIQDLFKTLQMAECRQYSVTFKTEKDKLIQKLISERDKTEDKKLLCNELDKSAYIIINMIPYQIKKTNPSVTPEDIKTISSNMEQLYLSIKESVCINGEVDIVRLDTLLTNIFDSICYSNSK